MTLNYRDIQAILEVIDNAPYDELQLENKDFSLTLKRSENGEWSQKLQTLSGVKSFQISGIENKNEQLSSQAEESASKDAEPIATEQGLVDVRSPMVGTFYSSPKPGSDSFVDIGSQVEENSIIAIIEVMKLMSSIPAKLKGEIREILVKDAELVEKGQLIMRVRASQS